MSSSTLAINDHSEFKAEHDDAQFCIESPIEQSHRHGRILARLLERLEIVGRTQKQPEFFHVVMLHPKARIQRPNSKVFDTSNVIKADQFPSWHGRFVDSKGVGTLLKAALNMPSLETIKEWGEKLQRQRRPADLLALPDFMQPKLVAPAHPSSPLPATPEVLTSEPARRLVCTHCGTKIS